MFIQIVLSAVFDLAESGRFPAFDMFVPVDFLSHWILLAEVSSAGTLVL